MDQKLLTFSQHEDQVVCFFFVINEKNFSFIKKTFGYQFIRIR